MDCPHFYAASMRDELTPEMITAVINDPYNPIGAEIARRSAKVDSGEAVTYTSDEVERMISEHYRDSE